MESMTQCLSAIIVRPAEALFDDENTERVSRFPLVRTLDYRSPHTATRENILGL